MIESDAGGVVVRKATASGSTLLRHIFLLGAPLTLALFKILHPQPVGISDDMEQAGRFLTFHVIQLPLIGYVALAVCEATKDLSGINLVPPTCIGRYSELGDGFDRSVDRASSRWRLPGPIPPLSAGTHADL